MASPAHFAEGHHSKTVVAPRPPMEVIVCRFSGWDKNVYEQQGGL